MTRGIDLFLAGVLLGAVVMGLPMMFAWGYSCGW